MKSTSGIHSWLRLTVVICTAFASVVAATAPAAGQQEVDHFPQALLAPGAPDVVEIRAGELPGRMVNGEEIDVKGCVQTVISDSVKTSNTSEGTIGTRGLIKRGAYLCGDGVAIANQIIVEGTTSELAKLQQRDNNPGVKLTTELVKPNPDKRDSKGINLYTITDRMSVVEKVKTINLDLRETKHISVLATPNYETASKMTALYGGSPSIGGSPSGPKGLARTEADFKNQWAWKAINKPASPKTDLNGNGVVVGIFDSFCMPAKYLQRDGTVVNIPRFAVIGQQAETSPITGSHIENVCAHGEFVWSLSHEVAPGAKYFFYPVLDEYGLGDTATLIAALEQFAATAQRLDRPKGIKELQGVVINLSLTINSAQGDIVGPLNDEITKLVDMGVTVVAAAGNDSSAGVQPMRPPAAFSNVIGVAAVQVDNQRASYSNWAPTGSIDVAAPGGDGDCTTANGAPYCVIGRDRNTQFLCKSISKAGKCVHPYRYVAGYLAWTGTSFATPLVSGLAALVIQKHNYTIAPVDVARELIVNVTKVTPILPGDAGIGAGIIDVDKTVP